MGGVHFPAGCFVHCSATVFFCALARQRIGEGYRLLLQGDEDVLRYLARMDSYEHLGVAYDMQQRTMATAK